MNHSDRLIKEIEGGNTTCKICGGMLAVENIPQEDLILITQQMSKKHTIITKRILTRLLDRTTYKWQQSADPKDPELELKEENAHENDTK
jgi:hypothetical protein